MRLNGRDDAGAKVLLRSCVGSLALLPQLMGRRISLTSFDGEGEEREGGRADKRDWHQEMMMMAMGGEKGGTKNCK